MKRMHIHIGVKNIPENIKFYSALFGAEPTKVKDDYAKWMLDDPRINFAISTRARNSGLDHLGVQVDSAEELAQLRAQFVESELKTKDEGQTVCCYSNSDKSWVQDPNGIAWEAYHTMEDANIFSSTDSNSNNSSCCVPEMKTIESCCAPPEKKSGCCG
jgi:catechol 2,3-dioxygenase-like lactoylglutathione lyase family enzyme